jgi:hypothetical protein
MFWFLTMVQIPDKIRAIIERNQNEKEEMFNQNHSNNSTKKR